MEGAVAIATGKLTAFSEEQLVDCSKAFGNNGCEGGLMDNGFKYIISNKGLTTEANYAYTAKDGTCDKTKEAAVAGTITSFKDVTKNSEDQMLAALAMGPVSVAIEADQPVFQHYVSGVLSGTCGVNLDHGVLAVGYGDDTGATGLPYYIVKNSWGETWGEKGYLRMKRGVLPSGECGILLDPSYPIAGAGPGPTPPGPTPPGPAPGPPSPGACSGVSPGNRTDCGFTKTEAECTASSCCYDASTAGTYKCFYPGGQCAVAPSNRTACDKATTSKSECIAAECCYDDSTPGTFYCFKGSGAGPTPPGPTPPGPTPPGPTPPGPSPGKSMYENPFLGPCSAGELNATVNGVPGSVCSPPCSPSAPCSTDVPAGTTAPPSCILEAAGASAPTNCLLVCGAGGAGGTCPPTATCKSVQGTGICTYNDGPTPPGPTPPGPTPPTPTPPGPAPGGNH